MSLGFSTGDISAVIELATKLRKELADAPSQFKDIFDELKSLPNVLQDVEVVVSGRGLRKEQKLRLEEITTGCWNDLCELEEMLGNSNGLYSGHRDVGKRVERVWGTHEWELDDIEKLRSHINTNNRLLGKFTRTGHTRENVRYRGRKLQRILDWLTPIDYASPQNGSSSRQQAGTGQWLIDSVDFRAWLGLRGQTLFCTGVPGAGKTILTSIVVENLQDRFRDNPSVGIAYLYCNFRRQDKQKTEDLLASLLKQLAQRQSSLPDSVKRLYDTHRDEQTRPSLDEISEALRSVATIYSSVFVIVDALDECQESNRTMFLSEIFSLQANYGINIFATSRIIPEIIEQFKDSTKIEIRASQEDVQRYLDEHMHQLPGFVKGNRELQEEIKTKILQSFDGMFLLAQLYLNSLIGKTSPGAIRTALKTLSAGSTAYDDAYGSTMERIRSQPDDEARLATDVLSWITCAKRPLTITELQYATVVEEGESEYDICNILEGEHLISVCAGLIVAEGDNSVVRFVHYTMKEYFERTQNIWFPNAESSITATCVTYLSFRVFESGFCQTDAEFKERLCSNPLYDYAAHYWGCHSRKAAESGQILMNFLRDKAKVEASSQAMLAIEVSPSQEDYSQQVSRMTGLHLAAHFGLVDAVDALVKGGNQPNIRDNNGLTPLWWSAKAGHKDVMKLLCQSDTITLHSLVQNGENGLIKSLLDAGYNVNIVDFQKRTPLHWAITSENLDLATELIHAGADIYSRDINGTTPFRLALESRKLNLVDLLVNKSTKIDITADEWRHAFPSDVLKLCKEQGRGYSLQSVSEGFHGELSRLSMGPFNKGYLLQYAGDLSLPWQAMSGSWELPVPYQLRTFRRELIDRHWCYCIAVWFPVEAESAKEYIRIFWNVIWGPNQDDKKYWKTMVHVSTLPYIWVPDNGIDFFQRFIRYLEQRWLELCGLKLKYLSKSRGNVLREKGDDPQLLARLLEDGQKWIDLRDMLQSQVDEAKRFGVDYSNRHDESGLEDLLRLIDSFSNNVSQKLSQLDGLSKDLIQMEFNLVSINEARRSTSTSTSMKRLSWITFIFLPLTFVSGIFGMNIDLLESNPPWWLYMIFATGITLLTSTVWIVFKRNRNLEQSIEQRFRWLVGPRI